MSYFSLFLPLSSWTILFVLLLFVKKVFKKNLNFTYSDRVISSITILFYSFFVLFCNLGFTLLDLNNFYPNFIFLTCISIHGFIYILLGIYLMPLGLLIGLILYLMNFYHTAIFSLYMADAYNPIIFSIYLYKILKNSKKAEIE